ncbi:MAG: tetratricopeptide repeat protein [Halodesulfovibrio sp.]|uniref:tetratricopeptide repeat protein n=1 Tax=Halodesulfovibrio sp. TaxID=1912772 RepID=UPI00359E48D3
MTNAPMKQPTSVAKIFIAAILLGFAIMLVTSGVYRTKHPNLTKFVQVRNDKAAEATPDNSAHIADLMGKLKSDANNVKLIEEIAQHFMEDKEYSQARKFIQRGIVAQPNNAHLFYMLGMANFKLESYTKAAKAFETSLTLAEDPSARYNLGVLLKYYLDKPVEGIEQFQKIIESSANKDLKAAAQKELDDK